VSTHVIVVGARGFVGGAIVAEARARGLAVLERRTDDEAAGDADAAIVYAGGVASGAARDPQLAFRRHVGDAVRWAAVPHRSFVYLSSTRVYDGADATREDARVRVLPGGSDPYVSSKVAGECAVLAVSPRAFVARLSNVAGPSVRSELFLSDILRQAASEGIVRVRSALTSSKDYIDVRDVAAWTVDLALTGGPRILNLAAGRNLAHGELLGVLTRIAPVSVVVADASPEIVVTAIDAGLVQATFPRALRDPLAELPGYFKAFQAALPLAIGK